VYLSARRSASTLELDLTGPWRIAHFAAIDRELAQVELGDAHEVLIGLERLETLDLSCSVLLRDFVQRLARHGLQVRFTPAAPDQLDLVEKALDEASEAPAPAPPEHETALSLIEEPVEALGRRVVRRWRALQRGFAFIGRLAVTLLAALTRPRRLRPTSVARQIYETGITAIPIISLIAFLISVIIAYLGADELQRFGAEIFVVDLVTIGVLRELGVLLTAIIVAGRSGSAFAAEIGAMRLNEEVDALQAIGVDTFEVLVLPRMTGLVIALPLLTVIADVIGLVGGALLCRFLLDIPLSQYMTRVNDAITSTTFWVGIIKAPVFAILIALCGTYRGLQVRDSSRELGRLTTVAVVQAIFFVILADALFAVLFLELDI
jgi:phospholipid/cholesterol/gamma-HCH transport system permease protein